MRVSIITPFYHGNQYLPQLFKSINKACSNFDGVELILINDDPDDPIVYDRSKKFNFVIREFSNNTNKGIHATRIYGISEAVGEYILFLDQDDTISPNSIKTQFATITKTNADIVLGNGYFETSSKDSRLIYDNYFSQKFAAKERPYIMARDFIVSPGQCIIRKRSIPQTWLLKPINSNGADDYLLWLLLFNLNAHFEINPLPVYTHVYTGNNYSLNPAKMLSSQLDVLKWLKHNSSYPKSKLQKLEKQIDFKANYKAHPIKYAFKHPIITIYNIYYRTIWRGYTC